MTEGEQKPTPALMIGFFGRNGNAHIAPELNNELKGIEQRKAYIEGLIALLPSPELVVLPELALCSYMVSREVWKYEDDCGRDSSVCGEIIRWRRRL